MPASMPARHEAAGHRPAASIRRDHGVSPPLTKVVRTFLVFALSLLAILLLAAGVLYWRLQQGAIEIGFLRPHVERAVNEALRQQGMRVEMDGVVLESDERTRLPTLHMRNLVLRDMAGNELASAPRAAVSMNLGDMLLGRARARFLELIGPSLRVVRTMRGEVRIGLTGAGGGADARGPRRRGEARRDETPAPAETGWRPLREVLRMVDRMAASSATREGGLEGIRISRATITLHDRRTGRLWHAPAADLVLRRVPYGYTMLATATVSSGAMRWQMQVNASYRREAQRLHMTLNLDDVLLSELASSLSVQRLAGARLPLSGAVELVFGAGGDMLGASGELRIGAGVLSFPEVIAAPLRVREGLLRVDYDPGADLLRIGAGYLLLRSTRAELAGALKPVRGEDGGIVAHDFSLRLTHEPLAARDGGKRPLIARIDARGRAWTKAARLDIEDLQMSGAGGAVRLRGALVQERDGVGIHLAGRGRDIDHRLVLGLWPPAVARGAREWLMEHLRRGRIPEGSFRLAIPARVLRAAIEEDRPMPDGVAQVRFKVRDVAFTHVDGWPAVEGAAGQAEMSGNRFRLELVRGMVRLKGGGSLKLRRGELRARDLAALVSPATMRIEAWGAARDFLALLRLPPHRLLQELELPAGRLDGEVAVAVDLSMPLSRRMTGRDVRVRQVRGEVRKARLEGFVRDMRLTDARLKLAYEDERLRISGKGRLNGLPVDISWKRRFGTHGDDGALELRAVLDARARRELGIDLGSWMRGAVPVRVAVMARKGAVRGLKVRADLSRVALSLDAIDWRRAPRKGTVATFVIGLEKPDVIEVRDLDLRGEGGLRVRGRLRLHRDGRFRDATFSRFELDANNRLALGIRQEDKGLHVAAAGPVFDARPFIRRMFASRVRRQDLGQPVFVKVNVERLLAERGESIQQVRGELELREGYMVRADLKGLFASGREVVLQMLPAGNGLRRLRIVSRDAGALLRASGLYSRVSGGEAEFTAILRRGQDSGVQRGLLVLRRFTVRGDERLARVQRQGRNKRGPRRSQLFSRLVLPFSTDERFIRIGNAIIKSQEIGATANGIIRRTDGAMDIGGTIIPAYALNSAIGNVPIIGQLLTGGGGQGIFGLNYALKGTIGQPKFVVNPLSAVAPGIFRQLFHVGGQNVNPDGTPRRPGQQRPQPRSRSNIVNGG